MATRLSIPRHGPGNFDGRRLKFFAKEPMKLVQAIILLAASAMAQAQPLGTTAAPSSRPAAGARAMASAEVLEVYQKEKRLLLKHGPIENIHMGAMTMEFGVADRKLLSRVKPGDRIRFAARRVGDDYLVTALEVTK